MREMGRALSSLVVANGFIPLWRRPMALIAVISTPFSFLFFIYLFGGESKLLIGAIGGILFTIVNASTMLQTDLLFYKLDLKFQQIVASTPVKPLVYTFGLALGNIVFTLPGLSIFMIIIVLQAHVNLLQILSIIGVLIVTWVIFSMFSFLVSTRIREMRDIWPISVMFSIIFGVVPPIYYSISSLPGPVQYVAYIVPTTWAAILLKGIVLNGFAGTAVAALVFVLEMLGVLAFTNRFSDWRRNRS